MESAATTATQSKAPPAASACVCQGSASIRLPAHKAAAAAACATAKSMNTTPRAKTWAPKGARANTPKIKASAGTKNQACVKVSIKACAWT